MDLEPRKAAETEAEVQLEAIIRRLEDLPVYRALLADRAATGVRPRSIEEKETLR